MRTTDRVRVYLNPCAWMVERGDGTSYMESFKFGEPVWEEAVTHGGETSRVVEAVQYPGNRIEAVRLV